MSKYFKKLSKSELEIIKKHKKSLKKKYIDEDNLPDEVPLEYSDLKIKTSDEENHEGPLSDDWGPEDWETHSSYDYLIDD